MSPASQALNRPQLVAELVRVWCEKTTDSPTDGTRTLMAATAALTARAAAAGEVRKAHAFGLRYVALERHLEYLLTGVRS